MSEYKYGSVQVTLPPHIEIDERAGKMSDEEVERCIKAPRTVGYITHQVAQLLEKHPTFLVPNVTADALRQAADRADDIDLHILDLENALRVFKQQNLLYDNAAYELLRRVNDQLNSQGKFDARLESDFAPVKQFFARFKKAKPEPKEK